MKHRDKVSGFLVSLALHGGLAVALMWQQSFRPAGIDSVALPLKLEMFNDGSKVASPEEPGKAIDSKPVEQPVPVVKKQPVNKEPVVRKKVQIEKHEITVTKNIAKPKKASATAIQSVTASQQPLIDSNASMMAPAQHMQDNDDIRARYLQQLMSAIAAHKYYPTRARRRKLEGQVEVGFVVKANGVIENVQLASSSGSKVLDKAAIEVLNRAQRFEPLPKELGLKSLAVVIPLDYRLL